MVAVREPILQLVPIASMRPTQITVGMREVHEKRRRWRAHKGKKRAEFLGKHMIPVILGPKEHSYIVDHHHLARALFDEGVKDMLVIVMADLKALEPDHQKMLFEGPALIMGKTHTMSQVHRRGLAGNCDAPARRIQQSSR